MEWMTCIKESISYMETHLKTLCSPEEVADHVHVSCMYLQQGFRVMTGYSLGEYMRNRKLYLAALDLQNTSRSVLDIALEYGYETPAGFDKAFTRFHGSTPKEARAGGSIRTFLPLTIQIQITGGENMKFRIETKNEIALVGFRRTFSGEDSYTTIPKFWDEMTSQYASHLMKGEAPVGEAEQFVAAHHIGEFGVCLDGGQGGFFDYMIAGYDNGDPVPALMSTAVIAAGTWAIFECTLKTLQDTNTRIWKEWLPGNSSYEVSGPYNIEWYSPEGEFGPGQKCEIWIPVEKKRM